MKTWILLTVTVATSLVSAAALAQGTPESPRATVSPSTLVNAEASPRPAMGTAAIAQDVPIQVRSETGPLQVAVSDIAGQRQVCTTPCQTAVRPGKVNLAPHSSTSPSVVDIAEPSVVTFTGRSTGKLVGGAALTLVGAAIFVVAVSGKVGLLPAMLLGAGGGGTMALGGSLIGDSGGGATVAKWQ